MQFAPGTVVKFADLTAFVVSNNSDGPYPLTRIQYLANGRQETVASDTLTKY